MSDETVFFHINNKHFTKFTYNSTLRIVIPLLHKSIACSCLRQLNTFNSVSKTYFNSGHAYRRDSISQRRVEIGAVYVYARAPAAAAAAAAREKDNIAQSSGPLVHGRRTAAASSSSATAQVAIAIAIIITIIIIDVDE
ncbi:unnamed protein product [Trichogramma brassicae]|uniref:Uncharacterized protein n=1 Tax=Trichogramma brassicae TaxID=86971 RepID=A0A6H5INJ2_9HYME|nr:unnamed protein product [Trichogramma brassicae]